MSGLGPGGEAGPRPSVLDMFRLRLPWCGELQLWFSILLLG